MNAVNNARKSRGSMSFCIFVPPKTAWMPKMMKVKANDMTTAMTMYVTDNVLMAMWFT